MALTNKQQVFIEEYLTCWNATEAARRAGYSEKSARVIGHENLTKPDIAEEIQRRIAEKTMSADEVLVRLAEQARGDISEFFDVHDGLGHMFFLNLDKAKRAGKLHLIKKLKYNANGMPEIELHDAQAALVHLGRHHKIFTDVSESKNETTINVDDATERLFGRINSLAERIREDGNAGGVGPDTTREGNS